MIKYSKPNKNPRIAIVHDFLNQMGGAERVVAVLHKMFPNAPIYTTIVDRAVLADGLQHADIRTTWMQRIPLIQKTFKWFFLLYPLAIKSIQLQEYDLVISSSSAFAKGVQIPDHTFHVCYCHTPMRFAWSFDQYVEGTKIPQALKWLSKRMMGLLRKWDLQTSEGVDRFIANSSEVQQRIQRIYHRDSEVIFPPVNISRFKEKNENTEKILNRENNTNSTALENGSYFLIVSRLVSYKRIELAVEACTKHGIPLVIIGD